MMNKNELKRIVAKRNTTLEALAKHLGINRVTLYRKTRGGIEELTLREVKRIIGYLHLSEREAKSIFGVC